MKFPGWANGSRPAEGGGGHGPAEYAGLALALAILVLVFSLSTEHFFSVTTFQTIANQIPALVLIATGMTFVLIGAGIDLSVGSVLGFCGAVLGVLLSQYRWPLAPALAVTLASGAICGLFNGWVTLRWRLPTFIVTLGMLEIARGAAHFVTHSQTQYIGSVIEPVAGTTIGGLSLPFLGAMGVVCLGQLTLDRTVFGRYLVAVGTNEEAVRLAGIDPASPKRIAFLLSGLLVALAAIIDTSRFQAANPNAGTGVELQALAAVVIGGGSLLGGRGSVVGSFLGVLIIAVLNAGLAAVGAKDENKRLITGMVIVGAVVLDQYRQRVRQQVEQVRQMAQREAVLEERARLAREIHDTLQQELSGIALQLDAVDAQLAASPQQARTLLGVARALVRHSQTEARHAVWNLRCAELADRDLGSAVRALAAQSEREHALPIQVQTEGRPCRLPDLLETHLFRISQEAITNAIKHARAQRIQIHLQYQPEQVRLRVEDNGAGFDLKQVMASGPGRFGLLGMQERARKIGARIVIQPRQPGGTLIEVVAPLSARAPERARDSAPATPA